MSKTDYFTRPSKSRSRSRSRSESTRFFTEMFPSKRRDIEVRSSHRRSSATKDIIPKLAIPKNFTVTFQMVKEDNASKSPKNTYSKMLMETDSKFSLQSLIKSLLSKKLSTIMDETSKESKGPARFIGKLWQEGSSQLTTSGIDMTSKVEDDVVRYMALSQISLSGDISSVSLGEIWPWPWLPPTLTSSEYISSLAQPVTFSLQEQLQVYPLLPLSHTLQEYIRSVKLFLRPEQLRHIEKLLKDFEKSSGDGLHNDIIKEYSTISLTDDFSMYWLPRLVPSVMRCLTRLEAPLLNAGILSSAMWDLWPAKDGSQLERATVLIQLSAEFARLIYSEKLRTFKDDSGYPLCNHQFRMLFSSSKIPGIPADATHCFFKTVYEVSHRSSPRHIVVICRGQMFCLNILHNDFSTVSYEELHENLQEILETAEENASTKSSGIGILTATDRDDWSETRVYLMEKSKNNRQCLQKLEEAMFVLTLEHLKSRGPDRLVNEALFADGCNRWYDKGLSFYMYQNGLLTVNLCSSIVDKPIVNSLLRFIHIMILEDSEKWDDQVLRKSGLPSRCISSNLFFSRTQTLSDITGLVPMQENSSSFSSSSAASTDDLRMPSPTLDTATTAAVRNSDATSAHPSDESCVRHLVFDIDTYLAERISNAERSFAYLSQNLSSSLCEFDGFDMNLLNDLKISLDAFAHLVLQLTFLKMYFRPPAVGSQVNIRRFYHAHYETMISTTEESLAWCYAMLKPEIPDAEKNKLFFAAVRKHVQRLEEVRSGLGCFHHLSALREIAVDAGDGASVSTLDILSDQPAGSPESLDISCEGCDTNDCLNVAVVVPPSVSSYGVGYVLANSRALFTVCSFKSCPSTCAENFSGILRLCLQQSQDFVIRTCL